MKSNKAKNSFTIMRVGILSLLMPSLVCFTGCGTFGDSAMGGAGATVGIMGAGMGVELARDVLLKGIKGVDKGQSSVSLHPSASAELSKAKKIAVLLQEPGEFKMPSGTFMGGSQDILEDSLAGQLMQIGYDVIGSDALASTTTEDSASRLQVLKEQGVELLVSGSVASGMAHEMKMGVFLGRSEMQMRSVINQASVRITTCEESRLIMTATVTYKKGKSAPDVAKDLAVIIDRARHSISQ